MDPLITGGALVAVAGAAWLAVLRGRPSTRLVAGSGYTVAAVLVVVMALVGIAGALALSARASSTVTREALSGVVEGAYLEAYWPPGGGFEAVNIPGSQGLLAREALEALEAASQAGGSAAPAQPCRPRLTGYSLVMLAPGRPLQAAPGGVVAEYTLVVIVYPGVPSGRAVLVAGPNATLNAIASKALGGAGLGVEASRQPPGPLGGLLEGCRGGILACILGGLTPLGGGVHERILPLAPTGSAVAVAVGPGDAERAIQALEDMAAGQGYRRGLAAVYALAIADIPDSCYSRVPPGSAGFIVRDSLLGAAPPGFGAYESPAASRRLGLLGSVRGLSTMGALLALVLFATVTLATASPLAATGAASLARGAAYLRLRGASEHALRGMLAQDTLASLTLGLGLGAAAVGLMAPGAYGYIGWLGLAAAAGVAVAAALLMYRRASREVGRVWVEAVARGNPLAVQPPPPPSGLGWLGWLSLALGVYHAARGYAGFSTITLIEAHQRAFQALPPALQALLGVWAFIEVFTAPFAPALLAYGVAKLLAWKSPSIVSSGLMARLLGRQATAARGLVGLVAGRAVALMALAVFASSLLAAVGLASGAASSLASHAAAAAVSPGILAVKPLEPAGHSLARLGNASIPVVVYKPATALGEALGACSGAVAAVAVPLYFYGPPTRPGALAGEPMVLAIVFQDSRGALQLFRAAGVRVEERLLETPGVGLYQEPGVEGSMSGGWRPFLLGPRGPVQVNVSELRSVDSIPGAGVLVYYSNLTLAAPEVPGGVIALGGWAYGILPRELEYPAGLAARPVAAIYTTSPSGECARALGAMGWRVYTPGDLYGDEHFRLYARLLGDALPAHYLAETALAAAVLAGAAALVLAADSEREVVPFMALLRLRGAGRREGARIVGALWGSLVGLAVLIGIAAGVGVAAASASIAGASPGGMVLGAVDARLPGGPVVTAVFTLSASTTLAYSPLALAYPVALGAALMAPLAYVGLKVYRGPIRRWLRW
ncbi:MAG: hypothetical protein GSR80_001034 [Desulfurococcales archaeon]|nr:hypothetical protein [Desulfurococcales archaeon]